MAKFSNDGAHALQPAVYFLANVANEALVLQTARSGAVLVPPPQPAPVDGEGHKIEDRFSILESYDTVFLIDDSPSMGGENWELVQKILDYSTVVSAPFRARNSQSVHSLPMRHVSFFVLLSSAPIQSFILQIPLPRLVSDPIAGSQDRYSGSC